MTSEVEALRRFLSEQDEKPTLHVNGHECPTALLSVDYGQPIRGVNISAERGNELTSLMKAAARAVTRRRGSVRVHYDNNHGVFWATLVASPSQAQ